MRRAGGEQDLVILEKRELWGHLTAALPVPTGRISRNLSQANRCCIKQGTRAWISRAAKQRNTLSKEVVSSPALEVFNTQLDEAVSNLV